MRYKKQKASTGDIDSVDAFCPVDGYLKPHRLCELDFITGHNALLENLVHNPILDSRFNLVADLAKFGEFFLVRSFKCCRILE